MFSGMATDGDPKYLRAMKVLSKLQSAPSHPCIFSWFLFAPLITDEFICIQVRKVYLNPVLTILI